jgi:hypothetical protein
VLSTTVSKGAEGSYTSWKQVTGYFDGDGNVGLEVVKRVVRLKLRFVDTWRPQILSIHTFLSRCGIRSGAIARGEGRGRWQAAYRLDITEVKSVIRTAKAMIGYSVKKRAELQVTVDYLEGRITGSQALSAFNEDVRSGRRRGKIRLEDIPYTRAEGVRLSKLENARKARAAYAVDVNHETQDAITKDHQAGMGNIKLSKKYGYSVSVIRRVLGAR